MKEAATQFESHGLSRRWAHVPVSPEDEIVDLVKESEVRTGRPGRCFVIHGAERLAYRVLARGRQPPLGLGNQVDLGDLQCSVFEVPKQYVKGRKSEGYVVCNSVSQAIVEQVRGQHDEFVFVWRRDRVKNVHREPAMRYQPIESMNNTAWQTAPPQGGHG